MIQVAIDLFDMPVYVGDRVVFTFYGHERMEIGKVFKVTPKRFYVHSEMNPTWITHLERNTNYKTRRIIKL